MSVQRERRQGGRVSETPRRARALRHIRPRPELLEPRELLTASIAEFPIRPLGSPATSIASGDTVTGNLWATIENTAGNNSGSVATKFDDILMMTTAGVGTQFQVPTLNAGVGAITLGPDKKSYWFVEASADQIGTIDAATHVITEFPLFNTAAAGLQDVVAGPDGNLWFTEKNADKVGVFNPTTHAIDEFALSLGDAPWGITVGADGNIWFTESGSNQLGSINPVTHVYTPVLISSGTPLSAQSITLGPDNNLWFTEAGTKTVAAYSTSARKFLGPYSLPVNTHVPSQITRGPGTTVWFSESGANLVGSIDTSVTPVKVKEYGTGFRPTNAGITKGPDGNLWAVYGEIGSVVRVTPAGTATQFAYDSVDTTPVGQTLFGPDGRVYFGSTSASYSQYELGSYDPRTGQYALTSVATGGYSVEKLANGPDGDVWFAEAQNSILGGGGNRIGVFDLPTGLASDFAIPTSGALLGGIAGNPGFGSTVWFTESNKDKIGFVNTASKGISDTITVPATESAPTGIVADGAGRLWVTMNGSGTVDAYDPTLRKWLATPVKLGGGVNSKPTSLAVGPGGKIYVVETGSSFRGAKSYIAVIDPSTGTLIKEQAATFGGTDPQIAAGPDGNIWFAAADASGSLGMMNVASSLVTYIAPPHLKVVGVSGGQGYDEKGDGNLWFTGLGLQPSFADGTYSNALGAVVLATDSTPAKLAVVQQPPPAVTQGKGFGLVVSVLNGKGQPLLLGDGATVTIAISPGSGAAGATLGGILTATVANGQAVFTGLTVDKPGAGYTITATSPGLTPVTSASIAVASAATHLVVLADPPASVASGATFTASFATEDGAGVIDTSYTGPVTLTLTSNPSGDTLGGTVVLGASRGVVNFNDLTLAKRGLGYAVTAAVPGAGLTPIVTHSFDVTGGVATTLVVTTAPPATVTAGVPFGFSVSAKDKLGNVDTAYVGPVTVASPSLGGTTTVNAVAGVATFAGLTLTKTGTRTLTISGGTLTPPTAPTVVVTAAAPSALVAAATPTPGTLTAGSTIGVTLTAQDAFGNTVRTFADNVNAVLTDPKGTASAYTFVNGVGTFNVVLKTAGPQTVTIQDLTTPALSSVLGTYTVTAAAASQLALSGPTTATAGASFPLTLTARDAFGNTATNYTGTVGAVSTDTSYAPGNTKFVAGDNGAHAFNVTLTKPGSQTLTFTDTARPALTATTTVAVGVGATSRLIMTGPGSVTVGVAFSVTVRPQDGAGNPTPLFNDVLHWTSTDPAALLPGDSPFSGAVSGLHTYPVTLKTAGTQSVTVTDTANGALFATLTFTPGVLASKVVITSPATSTTYGQSVTYTANVSPASGAGTPTGSVQFSVDGVNFGSPVALAGGVATTPGVTTIGAGSHTVAASYLGDGTYVGSVSAGLATTVAKAVLTARADNQAKVYGAALPAYTVSYSNFVNGENTGVLTGSPALNSPATPNSAVGTYTVTPSAGTLAAANYSFSFQTGTLTVTKAGLTVTADPAAKPYGAPLPALTWAFAGFQAGDTAASLTGSPLAATTATPSSGVGVYPITLTAGTLTSPNYTFTFAGNTLIVNKAHLTVTADHKAMPLGGPLPALTASTTGFVNGDGPAVMTGTPALATTATAASPPGTYPITVTAGSLAASNYDFTLVNGTLSVGSTAPADFDGIGKTEPAVFRPSTAQWFVQAPRGNKALASFGATNYVDIPLAGYFDGNANGTEQALYRPSTAQWFVRNAAGTNRLLTAFGGPGDIPVPGDYDGVGYTEPAVFRPSTGEWFVLGPQGGHLFATFGALNLNDIPVPGDYDGIGRTEPAVFRRSTAEWFVFGPAGGRRLGAFGAPNLVDLPAPGDYDGIGKTEPAVFRPGTGEWYVSGPTGGRLLTNFGGPNLLDLPVETSVLSIFLISRSAGGGIKGDRLPRSLTASPAFQPETATTAVAVPAPVSARATVTPAPARRTLPAGPHTAATRHAAWRLRHHRVTHH